jgi:hypothetical protein
MQRQTTSNLVWKRAGLIIYHYILLEDFGKKLARV